MIQQDETFDDTWPFPPKFCEQAGFPQHYVDEGAGRSVVLLHGQPTWGYIWRRFIPALSATHRVVVPDHMGLRQIRHARRPHLYPAHPCRQPDRLDRGAGPARHHAGDAGLGRPDRHRLRRPASPAHPQPRADEHRRRLRHRRAARPAQSAGNPLVPLDSRRHAHRTDRSGAVPAWFNHPVGDADRRPGTARPGRSHPSSRPTPRHSPRRRTARARSSSRSTSPRAASATSCAKASPASRPCATSPR